MITHFNFIVHAYHCGYPQGDPKQGACGHEQSWSATASNGMHELGQIRSQVTVVYRWNSSQITSDSIDQEPVSLSKEV